MEYRIRYRENPAQHDAETLVEAHSPAEAVVKFCATHDGREQGRVAQPHVTSVCAVAGGDGGVWGL